MSARSTLLSVLVVCLTSACDTDGSPAGAGGTVSATTSLAHVTHGCGTGTGADTGVGSGATGGSAGVGSGGAGSGSATSGDAAVSTGADATGPASGATSGATGSGATGSGATGSGATGSASSGAGGSIEACSPDASAAVMGPPSSWSSRAPLGEGPRQETGVTAAGGKVYVIGGFSLAGVVATVEVYDPATNTWSTGPSLPQPLHHANVATVGTEIFVTGFLVGGAFEPRGNTYVLDTLGGGWSSRAPMPAGTERGASAVAAVGTRIFVAGGLAVGAVDDVSVYDTATDSWTTLPALPDRLDHAAGAAVGGVFHVIGGRTGDVSAISGAVYAYDEASADWCARAPMPTPRGGIAAAVLGGKVVVAGGEGNPNDPDHVFREVEAFDPASNRWEILAPLSVGRHGAGAAVAGGAFIFPGGADHQSFSAVSTVEALTL